MMELVAAEEGHIDRLAPVMREADRIEAAAFGKTPRTALEHALSSSLWALTVIDFDEPIAMFGVSPQSMIESKGIPWMLGSDRIYENPRTIVRLVPGVVSLMRETFRTLENVVSVDNHRAQNFLRHWGWQLSEERIEIGGVQFVRFY